MSYAYGIVLFFLGCLVGVFGMALVGICRESEFFEDLDFYRAKLDEQRREAGE